MLTKARTHFFNFGHLGGYNLAYRASLLRNFPGMYRLESHIACIELSFRELRLSAWLLAWAKNVWLELVGIDVARLYSCIVISSGC